MEWADVVAFGTPAEPAVTGPELATTLAEIGLRIPSTVLRGKGATAFTSSYGDDPGSEMAVHDLGGRLLQLGFVTMPRPQGPVEQGVQQEVEQGIKQGTAFEYESARVHGRLAALLGRTVRGWQDRPTL